MPLKFRWSSQERLLWLVLSDSMQHQHPLDSKQRASLILYGASCPAADLCHKPHPVFSGVYFHHWKSLLYLESLSIDSFLSGLLESFRLKAMVWEYSSVVEHLPSTCEAHTHTQTKSHQWILCVLSVISHSSIFSSKSFVVLLCLFPEAWKLSISKLIEESVWLTDPNLLG